VDLTVVTSTQRNSELVADFAPKRATLREPQVMGVGGLPAANQASLFGNRSDVIPVTNPPLLQQDQCALIDLR
jgi:hypothetical protein